MEKTYLTNSDVMMLASRMAERIREYFRHVTKPSPYTKVYAIPRGGIPAAYALQRYMVVEIVDNPAEADLFIDDIIDSGKTACMYGSMYSNPLFSLIEKTGSYWFDSSNWIVFPWEKEKEDSEESVTDNITRLLQYVGEDPKREGLKDTPHRVIKAWEHWCSGYNANAAEILKSFEDGATNYDEMVIVKDIPLYSKCEHHLADIFGTVTVAYIPNGRIVGLSKINRLVDIFARRLQVQERLTNQIAEALDEHLKPLGVGVIIRARHMCMESRGICQQGHLTITSSLRGAIKSSQQARGEFLKLAE